MEELKPCRFCGGRAELFRVDIKDKPEPFYAVRCATRLECYRLSRAYKTPEQATQVWNEKATALELDMFPCPFCGNKGVLYNRLRHDRLEWHTSCNNVACCYLLNSQATPEEAIAAWNRRVTDGNNSEDLA